MPGADDWEDSKSASDTQKDADECGDCASEELSGSTHRSETPELSSTQPDGASTPITESPTSSHFTECPEPAVQDVGQKATMHPEPNSPGSEHGSVIDLDDGEDSTTSQSHNMLDSTIVEMLEQMELPQHPTMSCKAQDFVIPSDMWDADAIEGHVQEFGTLCLVYEAHVRELIDRRVCDGFGKHGRFITLTAGSFNKIWIFQCNDGSEDKQCLVLRITDVTSWGRYKPDTVAQLLRSEVDTMEYIKHSAPHFPIPEVVSYDETYANEVGHPYILMTRMPGMSLQEFWFRDELILSPTELETKRKTILTSLAQTMSQLSKLSFPESGMLQRCIDRRTRAPTLAKRPMVKYRFDLGYGQGEKRVKYSEPQAHTCKQYFKNRLVTWKKNFLNSKPDLYPEEVEATSQYKLAAFIIEQMPDDAGDDVFVVAHPDFNWQNILVDPQSGEVTGVIDWDGVHTVPRQLGAAPLPLFLAGEFFDQDWEEMRTWPGCSSEDSQGLRDHYVDSVRESLGAECGDARYTAKSYVWMLLWMALGGLMQMEGFYWKLLWCVGKGGMELPEGDEGMDAMVELEVEFEEGVVSEDGALIWESRVGQAFCL